MARKQHNNNGGQFPLGQMLAGVIGGGEANPDYQAALAAQKAGGTLTPEQTKALQTGPYNPNNVFQKYYGQDTADRGNMAWKAAEHEDALALARTKAIADYQQQLELKGIPLKTQAELQAKQLKDTELGKDLADASYNWNRSARPGQPLIPTLSPQEYNLMLGSRAQQIGIPQSYQDAIAATYGVPLAGRVETSGQQARIGANDLSALNASHAIETENRVHPYNLSASGLKAETGVTNARIGAKQAHGMENRLPHLEATLDTQASLGDQYADPEFMAGLAHRMNIAVPKDASMFNVVTGSPSFQNSPLANMSLNRPQPVGYHPVFGPIYGGQPARPAAAPQSAPAAVIPQSTAPTATKAPEPQAASQNPLGDYGLIPSMVGATGVGLKRGFYDPLAESVSGIYQDVLKPAGRYWFTGNPIDEPEADTVKESPLPMPKRKVQRATIQPLVPTLQY